MAGEWIPMRTDLHEDPAVIGLAATLGVTECAIVGCLHRLWSFASLQTADGRLPFVTPAWIDDVVRCPGFSSALAIVGWLTIETQGVTIPKFTNWLSQGAKARLGETIRKRMGRCPDKVPDKVPDKNRTTGQDITGQKKDPPTPKGGDAPRSSGELKLSTEEFLAAWTAVPRFIQPRGLTGKRLRAFQARAHDPEWVNSWREALEKARALPFCLGANDRGWRATVDWFFRPDTVTKLLEGAYDFGPNKAPVKHNPRDDRRAPSAAETAQLLGRYRAEKENCAPITAEQRDEIRKRAGKE